MTDSAESDARFEEFEAKLRETRAQMSDIAERSEKARRRSIGFAVGGALLLVVNLALLLANFGGLAEPRTWLGVFGVLVSAWIIASAAHSMGSMRSTRDYMRIFAETISDDESSDEASV